MKTIIESGMFIITLWVIHMIIDIAEALFECIDEAFRILKDKIAGKA